jgi:hypothetical protein
MSENAETRTYLDFRQALREVNCSLTICGQKEEVLATALAHAVNGHGLKDSPMLLAMLRNALKGKGER